MCDKNWVVRRKPRCWMLKSMRESGDIYMSATMKAAVHLGPHYDRKLCTTKNTDFEQRQWLFDISQSLILNHGSENCGISTIEWHLSPWRRSALLHDRAINLLKTKVTRAPCFVLERCTNVLPPWKSGKNKLNGSSAPRIIKNFSESTESHLSSSGVFSQGTL